MAMKQFTTADGKRRTIRFAKLTKRQFADVSRRIDAILAATFSNQPLDLETAKWIGGIDDRLHAKLAAAGLVAPRVAAEPAVTLGAFLQSWFAKRQTAKLNSRTNYGQAIAKLTGFFGDAAPLDSITPTRAEDFARDMASKHAKEWTWRLVKFARQFFKDAVRDRLITANPFDGVKPPAQATKSRQFFITRDATAKVSPRAPMPNGG